MSQNFEKTVSVACDHGGLQLKNSLAEYLTEKGYVVRDFGTYTSDSCDYPDFAYLAANAVSKGESRWGIVVCTTGIGVSMVANKVKKVRCALCHCVDCAVMTRRHNDANVLALGAKYVSVEDAKAIADAFLTTEFEGGRHTRRVDKITAVENGELNINGATLQ